MFKGTINNYSATASTNLPITVVNNTNSNISYDSTNNVIEFNTPGWYDVTIQLVCTNVAVGQITLTEYINSTAQDINAVATSGATTSYYTISLPDVIHVVPASLTKKATLSYQLSTSATVSSAVILIEARR